MKKPVLQGASDSTKFRNMIQTVEAIIEASGEIRLLEDVHLDRSHRALVTILTEGPQPDSRETMLMSEAALAADWERSEEEEAWAYLQKAQ